MSIMQFINIKELVFKNNGFEPTKIDHMNYSNPISTEEFNKVVDKIVKDLSDNEENKCTVMKTPMTESKEILICYNTKGILSKILIIYITDVQDKLIKEEDVAAPILPPYRGELTIERDTTDIILDINSEDMKDQFNAATKAMMIGCLIANNIDVEKINKALEIGKKFIK